MAYGLEKCMDTEGTCFARRNGKCVALRQIENYKKCSFKKPEQFITNGIKYPEKHPSEREEPRKR